MVVTMLLLLLLAITITAVGVGVGVGVGAVVAASTMQDAVTKSGNILFCRKDTEGQKRSMEFPRTSRIHNNQIKKQCQKSVMRDRTLNMFRARIFEPFDADKTPLTTGIHQMNLWD
uniref:Uncharacterized protein n=1 Tax=Vespula pensylvanica TaxID=30213 RepID=A0A834UCP8_VESPE|nr:hypothetical protein H0235_004222 [Vespula pensylvanica]